MNTVKSKTNKGKTFAFIKHLRNGAFSVIANNERVRLFTDIDKNEYLIYSDINEKVINIEQIERG
jgi:hypothetical protein